MAMDHPLLLLGGILYVQSHYFCLLVNLKANLLCLDVQFDAFLFNVVVYAREVLNHRQNPDCPGW